MMKWVIVSEEYLLYLRSEESRIPKSEYGINKFKPFFGVLFETEDFYYVTQVSSPKERHIKMKQINKLNVGEAAKKLFELKRDYPSHAVSQRCIDFQKMEIIAKRYVECM